MKKTISLLFVAMLASSVFAIPATVKKMQATVTPREKAQVAPNQAMSMEIPSMQFAAQKANKLKAVTSVANKAKAVKEADGVQAFYYKPEGSMFCGIGDYYSYVGTNIFTMYPAVIGSWLNGYEYWTWPNYSSASDITYYDSFAGRGYQNYMWTTDANNNYLDSFPALEFGDPTMLFSYRMPMQIASNGVEKDSFFLIGTDTLPLKNLTLEAWTLGGMFNPFTTDGMWPFTNAIFSTPKYGEVTDFVYSYDKEAKTYSFIYGTTPFEPDTNTHAMVQPSVLLSVYEKPMSPLYVKNITMAVGNLKFEEDKLYYADAVIDTLQLLIIDRVTNQVVATSIATKEDTASMMSYPGQMITFKIEKKDEYGTITEGVTLKNPFAIYIMGLNRPGNQFGIWSGLDPYMGGAQTAIIGTDEELYQYAPFNPFIMLNGTYYTLEHACRTPYMYNFPAQYADTINIAVELDTENSEYYAYHADGDFEGYIPTLRATELLYDTVTYKYNCKIDAPDWAQLDMDGYDELIADGYSYTYWSYFHAYNLYIWGDASDTNVDAPAVGDEIKISRYGAEIVFKVVSAPTQGIKNVKAINDNKTYNVLGIEVGEDYKGVVIRNGEKFIR